MPSEIWSAVSTNDIDALKRLLSSSPDVDEVSGSPLRTAIEEDLDEALQLLLQYGVAPSEKQLELYVDNARHPRSVVRLANAGFNVFVSERATRRVLSFPREVLEELVACCGVEPSTVASLMGDAIGGASLSALRWCAEQGAGFSREPSALFEAALGRDEDAADVVRWLHGCGVSADGTQLLVRAASAKKSVALERVKALVAAGATPAREGWTALAEAVYRNNKELALFLVSEGADPAQPVGYSPYDWKGFMGNMSPQDYAAKKGREWFGVRRSEPMSFPSDTPGFNPTTTWATLIYGRRVHDSSEDGSARAAKLVEWLNTNGSSLSVVGEGAIRPGQPLGGLVVGVTLQQANADHGPVRLLAFEDAKKMLQRAGKVWDELEQRFGFSFGAQRTSHWLVASGPLALAGLIYGVPRRPKSEKETKTLSTFHGQDSAQRAHRHRPFGVVEATDGSKRIQLTSAAMKKRQDKTKGLPEPEFFLAARYD